MRSLPSGLTPMLIDAMPFHVETTATAMRPRESTESDGLCVEFTGVLVKPCGQSCLVSTTASPLFTREARPVKFPLV